MSDPVPVNEDSPSKIPFIDNPMLPLRGKPDEEFFDDDFEDEISTVLSGSVKTHHTRQSSREVDPDMDMKQFSMRDLENIFNYSRGLVAQRSIPLGMRDTTVASSDAKIHNVVPRGKIDNLSTVVNSKINSSVSKKDHCNLSVDQIQKLGALQFSISNKDVNSKLDQLHAILVESGLISLVNGQRLEPVPTTDSPIGYTPPRVIYCKPEDPDNYFLNKFIADTSIFNVSTHTEAIAIGADDLLCYAADKVQLLKAMKLAFNSSLILIVQPFLRGGQIVKAFHAIIEKIRGQRQSDREYARKKYADFVKFDPALEIGVSIAVLTNLQISIEFATNIPFIRGRKESEAK